MSVLHSCPASNLGYTGPVAFPERDGSIQPAHGTSRWAKIGLKNLTTRYTRKYNFHGRRCCWGHVGSSIFRTRLGSEAPWCLSRWHRMQGSQRDLAARPAGWSLRTLVLALFHPALTHQVTGQVVCPSAVCVWLQEMTFRVMLLLTL